MHKKAIEIKERILGSEVRTTLAKSRRSLSSNGSNWISYGFCGVLGLWSGTVIGSLGIIVQLWHGAIWKGWAVVLEINCNRLVDDRKSSVYTFNLNFSIVNKKINFILVCIIFLLLCNLLLRERQELCVLLQQVENCLEMGTVVLSMITEDLLISMILKVWSSS